MYFLPDSPEPYSILPRSCRIQPAGPVEPSRLRRAFPQSALAVASFQHWRSSSRAGRVFPSCCLSWLLLPPQASRVAARIPCQRPWGPVVAVDSVCHHPAFHLLTDWICSAQPSETYSQVEHWPSLWREPELTASAVQQRSASDYPRYPSGCSAFRPIFPDARHRTQDFASPAGSTLLHYLQALTADARWLVHPRPELPVAGGFQAGPIPRDSAIATPDSCDATAFHDRVLPVIDDATCSIAQSARSNAARRSERTEHKSTNTFDLDQEDNPRRTIVR